MCLLFLCVFVFRNKSRVCFDHNLYFLFIFIFEFYSIYLYIHFQWHHQIKCQHMKQYHEHLDPWHQFEINISSVLIDLTTYTKTTNSMKYFYKFTLQEHSNELLTEMNCNRQLAFRLDCLRWYLQYLIIFFKIKYKSS